MFNIVSNAVRYTPDGGRIGVFFSEEPTGREDYANFTPVVKDTGIGIFKEFLPHIFDMFSRENGYGQAEATVKTENDGSVVIPEIFGGKRILPAEDNELNAEIAMDIQMPNMDGIKAASVIRGIPNKTKLQIPTLTMCIY